MTMTDSPITSLLSPPPELVKQWQYEANHNEAMFPQVATQAARWGADQELDACVEWLRQSNSDWEISRSLRIDRRPKPPSLKEQALKALTAIEGDFNTVGDRADTIRRALEALPND